MSRANKGRAMMARRFPPPWSVDEQDACFVVRDHNGQALAYVYFEDEPGQRCSITYRSHPSARCPIKLPAHRG